MAGQRFHKVLGDGAAALGVTLDTQRIEHLYRYFQELRHWSARTNLISRGMDDEAVVENHFVDSLAVLSVLDRQPPTRLLDVGSGAGFPGLVCKIARPELAVSLLEPRLKRVSFLRHVVRTLGCTGIEVQAGRLDDRDASPDGTAYDCVVSRAVAGIADFLALCTRFRRSDCRVMMMKGPRYHEELADLDGGAGTWMLADRHHYRLPLSGAERVLLVFHGEPHR